MLRAPRATRFGSGLEVAQPGLRRYIEKFLKASGVSDGWSAERVVRGKLDAGGARR
jgi:hypothetical protein